MRNNSVVLVNMHQNPFLRKNSDVDSEGLHESIKRYLTAVTSLQVVSFYQLIQAAIKIEKSKMKSRETKKEKKFSRGGSSSGKRPRESQVDSVQGSATRGRRQGPTMTHSSCRGTSTEQEERHACPHCHKYHLGICKRVIGGCFRCGGTDHMITNCPRGSESSRNPQGSGREISMYLHKLKVGVEDEVVHREEVVLQRQ